MVRPESLRLHVETFLYFKPLLSGRRGAGRATERKHPAADFLGLPKKEIKVLHPFYSVPNGPTKITSFSLLFFVCPPILNCRTLSSWTFPSNGFRESDWENNKFAADFLGTNGKSRCLILCLLFFLDSQFIQCGLTERNLFALAFDVALFSGEMIICT